MRTFFAGAAETLVETDYEDACPIATVALEVASTNEPLRQATADVFESWIAAGAGALRAERHLPSRARASSRSSFIAALEGAFVLCRALRSTEPLLLAGETVAAEVEATLRA